MVTGGIGAGRGGAGTTHDPTEPLDPDQPPAPDHPAGDDADESSSPEVVPS